MNIGYSFNTDLFFALCNNCDFEILDYIIDIIDESCEKTERIKKFKNNTDHKIILTEDKVDIIKSIMKYSEQEISESIFKYINYNKSS